MLQLDTVKRRISYQFSETSAEITDHSSRAERNVKRNLRRQWPPAEVLSDGGTAILVGSGPSLNIDEVKSVQGDVFAIGKQAAATLNAAGIVPDYLVLTSPKPDARLPPAKHYLFATHCDPALFDRDKDIHVFSCPIGPAGATALTGVINLGYRKLHIHGFDSSYSDGPVEVECGGRKFKSTIWLASQIDSAIIETHRLRNMQGEVTLYGDGLLQHSFRLIQQPTDSPADVAAMDFTANPVNFDFVTWLAAAEVYRRRAKCEGPLRVRLTGIGDDPVRQRFFENVIRPVVQLFGAVEDETARSDRLHHFSYKVFAEAFRAGEQIPKIFVPAHKITGDASKRLTITLREVDYMPERNSDVAAWLQFARRRREEGYNVIFVRDTAKADEPLEDFETCPTASRDLMARVALYNASHCNLLRDNGPVGLIIFSDLPFIVFTPLNTAIAEGWHGPQHLNWWTETAGFTPPDKFPWLTDDQQYEWVKDTAENIEAGWQRWQEQHA